MGWDSGMVGWGQALPRRVAGERQDLPLAVGDCVVEQLGRGWAFKQLVITVPDHSSGAES